MFSAVNAAAIGGNNAFKGSQNSMIPNLTFSGGAAGPSSAGVSTNPIFGNANSGFKIGLWGFVSIAAVSIATVYYLIKK